MLALLKEYQNVFAWTLYEAPSVDSKFAGHELNVLPDYKPVVQKARRTAPQHAEAVREEVDRPLKIGAVCEVLSTVVVQHCRREKEKWEMEGLCGFHQSKQNLPKGSLPTPKDGSISRLHDRS